MKTIKKQWPFFLLALLFIGADQVIKLWTRTNIPLGASKPFLPGVVELSYVQNSGAAFSILSSHTWLLTLISALCSIALIYVLWTRKLKGNLGNIALAMVLGGAVGNLIDRAAFSYVVDMFKLEFMNFAVFNFADIGVTVGGVLLCIYLLVFWDEGGERERAKADS